MDAVYEICEVAAPITATKEAVLMIEPLPRACMCGIACLQHRYTDVRLTSCTRRHASRPVTRIESSSGGEMPALLKAMSRPPYAVTALVNNASTCASSVTSTWTNVPPTSSAAAWPVAASMSAHDHVRALGGEAARGRQPDAAAGAGHDGHPSLESVHRGAPRSVGGQGVVDRNTFLVSVNAASASGPSSRPSPDCLNPPNGVE